MKRRLLATIAAVFTAVTMALAVPVLPVGNLVTVQAAGPTYTVVVSTGYLALRSARAYDSKNEIGSLYTGDQVQVEDTSDAGTGRGYQ